MKIALMILQMLCGLFLIVIIMLQSGKNSGLSGAIGGQSEFGGGFAAQLFKQNGKFRIAHSVVASMCI